MLLKEAGDRESLSARVTRPGLLARVSPFVDIQVRCQLVRLATHIAAEWPLIGV